LDIVANSSAVFGRSSVVVCQPASFAPAILELFDDLIEVGISGAEAAGEPIAPAPGNLLAISKHFELTDLAGDNGGVDS
jgi:hypothetical protein